MSSMVASQTIGDLKNMADSNQSFLRAARSGNLQKLLEYLTAGTEINTCNPNGLNALHLASKEGHVNVVRELLMRGADPDACTKKGNTSLHIACLAGQFEVVKLLLEKGATVNCQSSNGFTPLYMAAQENHMDVVKHLLANGASQSLATTDGFTPLAVALQQGHDKVVANLLENDARGRSRMPALHVAAKKDDVRSATLLLTSESNANVQAGSGFTALHIAAHYGSINVAALLVEKGADVNFQARNNITPLHVAAKWGMLPVVQKLVECSAEIDCKTRDGLTPLHCAARSGQDAVVDYLLNANANFNLKSRSGLSPLHMAAQGDHVDSARLLLVRGANIDDTTIDLLTPLHVAAHCGYTRVAKLFLEKRCMVNARALNGFTPLHIACKKNRIRVIELLLQYGCAVEATTESGLTPLHVAAFMGHTSVVVMLIQNGANPNTPTIRSETALHLAVRSNQLDVVRVLLRNGAQVDARARDNQTPLHIASRLGNADMVSLLLQSGSNADAACKDNYTALHVAAREGHEEVITLLLDRGANHQLQTKKGATPLHNAAKYDKLGVAKILLARGADPDAQGRNGLTPLHMAAHYNRLAVAQALLESKANANCLARNGYTPLHIAVRRNHKDMCTMLLGFRANSRAESKSGFAPLHLAAQEGFPEICSLLLNSGALVDQASPNGITPLHLAAQEDKVNSAEVLVTQHGGQIDPSTKAGYTPLHTACFFGQINMVRFLLRHGAAVNAITLQRFSSLHVASQQGHLQIVYVLLENGADPNMRNSQNWTAAHIAKKQNYINIFEALRRVTTTIENWEEEIILEETIEISKPDTIADAGHMSESDDEAGANQDKDDYTVIPASPMFSRPDDSEEPPKNRTLSGDTGSMDETREDIEKIGTLTSQKDNITIEHIEQSSYMTQYKEPETLTPPENYITGKDNVAPQRIPVVSGFLVSFLVDARGGAMNSSRCPGMRVIIPPNAASAPTRVTCRLMRRERVAKPPPLNDGEGLACRILEMGPMSTKFNSPVLLEIPHYASLRDREREIVVFRSENGETWKEHQIELTEQAVLDAVGGFFSPLETNEDLRKKRIMRILTPNFPQYFALITRVRQESALIGAEGGVISSTVISQVQAVFPEGALTKKIRVGIQAQPIQQELVTKLLGARVAVSPVVTIEPRRRKFHKPITLTIPLPRPATRGITSPGESPTLRLLCSITGGAQAATWEDITGSTPLSYVKDCVSFTTTVSARFWLMDCHNTNESATMAGQLYKDAVIVPYIGRFVIFAKRHDPDEAKLRCFCITDDKVDKTLECNEGFERKAESREVEVLDGKPQWVETVGNLVPVTKAGEQLCLHFNAFRENRLACIVKLRDPAKEPVGKIAFLRDPRPTKSTDSPPMKPTCTLEVVLPDYRSGEKRSPPQKLPENPDLLNFVTDHIARSELDLREIADCVRGDWPLLARELGQEQSDITHIKVDYRDEKDRAFASLCKWQKDKADKATGNELERALRRIGREDIIKMCMRNVEYVVDESEKHQARKELEDKDSPVKQPPPIQSSDDSLDIVPVVDDKHGVTKPKSPDETEEQRKAKTAAYLSLIDKMNDIIPEPEINLPGEEKYDGAQEVTEDSVAVTSRDARQAPAPSGEAVEDLLSKLDSLPSHSMAPEEIHDEVIDVKNTKQVESGRSLSPMKSPEHHDEPELSPEEKDDARKFVEDFMAPTDEDASQMDAKLQDEGEDEHHHKHDPDHHGHHHGLTHRHEVTHGAPREEIEEEVVEEVMPDGTIIKKRIVRKRVYQEVTERIITEGCADIGGSLDEHCPGHASATAFEHPPHEDTDKFEEEEEVLEDGSVVRRTKRTKSRRTVEEFDEGREERPESWASQDSGEYRRAAGGIVSEAIQRAIDDANAENSAR